MNDNDSLRFQTSIQTRNLEIELFWKRSVFFWGFIASAFIGYAALRNNSSDLSIMLACFGMVCSLAWTLLNRGSKYWYESWEAKVERHEGPVVGELFSLDEPIMAHKGPWLRARAYSVSKLAIALSDYVLLLWTTIVICETVSRLWPAVVDRTVKGMPLKDVGLGSFVFFSFFYLVLLLIFGRRSLRKPKKPMPTMQSSSAQ